MGKVPQTCCSMRSRRRSRTSSIGPPFYIEHPAGALIRGFWLCRECCRLANSSEPGMGEGLDGFGPFGLSLPPRADRLRLHPRRRAGGTWKSPRKPMVWRQHADQCDRSAEAQAERGAPNNEAGRADITLHSQQLPAVSGDARSVPRQRQYNGRGGSKRPRLLRT
jgi:hypothetical protein